MHGTYPLFGDENGRGETMKKVFIKGAWLCSLGKELTEEEFIEKAGGISELSNLKGFPFVSLILDDEKKPQLVGHIDGRTITLALQGKGHTLWQTMEWEYG